MAVAANRSSGPRLDRASDTLDQVIEASTGSDQPAAGLGNGSWIFHR
jgi:hypothetical protein